MNCTVRSADHKIFEGDVDRVVARSPYGEFAVMNGHAPLLCVLRPGVVRWHTTDREHRIVCSGGVFSLLSGHATVLVERPVRIEDIDLPAMRAKLADIQSTDPENSQEIQYLELLCQVKEKHD